MYWSNCQVSEGHRLKSIHQTQKKAATNGDKILFIYDAINNTASVRLNNTQIHLWDNIKRIDSYYFAITVYYGPGHSITILNINSMKR